MSSVFHTYDIRGIVGEGPDVISVDFAYKLGQVLVLFSKAKNIFVCRDARVHSPMLFDALCKGITDTGCNVSDLGISTIPYMVCSLGHLGGECGIMITASHNTGEYNGFKINMKGPRMIYEDNGLREIEMMMKTHTIFTADVKGSISSLSVMDQYLKHLNEFYKVPLNRKIKIVIDAGNGVGFITAKEFFKGKLNIDVIELYTNPDGTFPHHEANPVKFETLKDLQKTVKQEKADLGIAYDGDADRVVFIDRHGDILLPDQTAALLAAYELSNLSSYAPEIQDKKKNRTLYVDLRFSKAVDLFLQKKGATVERMRVGNPFYKEKLFTDGGLMASEMSGHIMYPENFNADDALFATIKMLNILSSDIDLASIRQEFFGFVQSQELNYKVKDADEAIRIIEQIFSDAYQTHMDGVTVESNAGWWFNLRKSNTEPLVRLRIEGHSQQEVDAVKARIESAISALLISNRDG